MKRALIGGGAAVALLLSAAALACTVAVISAPDGVLFCNNEDWSDPKTRIWFVPSTAHYGCAYVGFSNGWGQGGVNTQGLAFDGVAGYREEWEHDGVQAVAPRHSVERMLESCATVEEAIVFYQTYWEAAFAGARLVVADRSGASAVIGAKDGKLHVIRRTTTFAMGYRGELGTRLLASAPQASVANGAAVLRAARQAGKYATKYSNVYDLRSGDIFVYQFGSDQPMVRFNLQEELKKGDHFYDLPEIAAQRTQPPKPLPPPEVNPTL